MDENKIVNVKALLYDADTDEVKRIISQTEDQEILYVYAYNCVHRKNIARCTLFAAR